MALDYQDNNNNSKAFTKNNNNGVVGGKISSSWTGDGTARSIQASVSTT
jgi:hypothetical protein